MLKNTVYFLSSIVALVLAADCQADSSSTTEPKASSKEAPANNSSKLFKAFTGKVNGNKVRLRTTPDLDGKVVADLSKGDILVVVGENNGYYAVQPPKGTKAYVFRSFVLDDVVEGSHVNVRLEPTLEAPVIAQLNAGDRVRGTISSLNNKWLEISPPASTKFYVAKEYVQSVGGPEVFEGIQTRKIEVDDLLDKAYTTSQNELLKSFDQINLEKIYQQYNKVLKEYQDFPEQVTKAREAMDLVQKTYLQKQIAFLESRTQQTQASSQPQQSSIESEIESYQKRLAELEEQLKRERNYDLAAADNANPGKPVNPQPPRIPQDNGSNAQSRPSSSTKQADRDFGVPIPSVQMKYWIPLEDGYYHSWLHNNPPADIEEFYKAEYVKAVSLDGVLTTFNQTVKNRPGDYVLKVNNLPVAYLYSTRVNLQDKVGKHIRVMAVSRPNNNFAYPAFFVLSIE